MNLAKNLLTNYFCRSIMKSPNSERRFFIMKKSIIKVLSFALVAVMMCAVLVSCGGPNKDPKKAEEALKAAGYEVRLVENDEADEDGAVAYIQAMKSLTDFVQIAYYDSKDAASKAYEEAKKVYEEGKEEYEALGIELIVKQSGTMVYMGTKDAIKAAK